jgi:hypothetical protein
LDDLETFNHRKWDLTEYGWEFNGDIMGYITNIYDLGASENRGYPKWNW